MSDTTKMADMAWKAFTVLLGVVVVPTFGWVWSTNIQVENLKNDLADVEEDIADVRTDIITVEQKLQETELNARAIIKIGADIEYMNATLARIERLLE